MNQQLALEFRQALPADLCGLERRAAEVLLMCEGREGRMGAGQLAQLLDLDERAARKVVEGLIVERGLFICSTPADGGGYYVPASHAEAQECVHSLRGRALHILRRASCLAKNAGMEALAGQLRLACREAGVCDT